ncbi:MAG: hypothetical protein K5769_08585 [Pseudobutyrivibrio sp.]|nr:hypothetical protein [Pseudobutyrivibrio sp.]
MSQEKVDQKKHDKTHRKALVRKKKIEHVLSVCCVLLVTIAIVGWIGFSIYDKAEKAREANKEYEYFEVDTSAISDYIDGLNN